MITLCPLGLSWSTSASTPPAPTPASAPAPTRATSWAETARAVLPAFLVTRLIIVAAGALYSPEAFGIGTPGHIRVESLLEMSIGLAIGAITFSGSVIAFAKLDGRMSGAPIILPYRHLINIGIAVAIDIGDRAAHAARDEIGPVLV